MLIVFLLIGCKAKKKLTEATETKEKTEIVIESKQETKETEKRDSTATIVTISTNDIIEVEADTSGVVTKKTEGGITTITGAKKITFRKEEEKKDEVVNLEVEKEKKEDSNTVVNIDQTKQEKKRTSNVDIKTSYGFIWWIILILIILLILSRFKQLLRFFGIPIPFNG